MHRDFFYRPIFFASSVMLCLASSVSPVTLAASSSPLTALQDVHSNTWFVGLGGGISWLHLDNSTTVNNGVSASPPADNDYFSINAPKETNAQILVGYRFVNDKPYFPYTNVFFQYRSYINDDITGYVEQFSSPDFLNYNYKMTYSADLLTINGKVDLMEYKHVMPFISAGAGVIFNSLYNYTETATANVTPRVSPAYTTNNSSHLALTLGAGIDYRWSENYWVTLGYEHVFQGSLQSGPGLTTWSGTQLDFGNMKMDTLFINFSMNLPTKA